MCLNKYIQILIVGISIMLTIPSHATKFNDLSRNVKGNIISYLDLNSQKNLRLSSKYAYPHKYFYNLGNSNIEVYISDYNISNLIQKYDNTLNITSTIFVGRPNRIFNFIKNTNVNNIQTKIIINSNDNLNDFNKLINDPITERITYLHIEAKTLDKTKHINIANIIANSKFTTNLQTLDLTDISTTNQGLKLINDSSYLNQVENLILNNNNLSSEGITYLFSSGNFNKIKYLKLNNNDLSNLYLPSDSSMYNTIESLSLKSTKIYDQDVKQIVEKFKKIISINIADNNLENEAIKYLANSIFFKKVASLNISSNIIDNESINYLINSPYLNQIEELNIQVTSIDDDGINSLVKSKNFKHLKKLFLGGQLTELSLSHICDSEIAPNLEILNIWTNKKNNIDYIIKKLDGLSKIESLTLYMYLDDIDFLNLSKTSINNKISTLGLHGNLLTDLSANIIAEEGKFANLEKLNVSGNKFSNQGLKTILINKSNLQYIDFANNQININDPTLKKIILSKDNKIMVSTMDLTGYRLYVDRINLGTYYRNNLLLMDKKNDSSCTIF